MLFCSETTVTDCPMSRLDPLGELSVKGTHEEWLNGKSSF